MKKNSLIKIVFVVIVTLGIAYLVNNNLKKSSEYAVLSTEYSLVIKKNSVLKESERIALDTAKYYRNLSSILSTELISVNDKIVAEKFKKEQISEFVADISENESYDSLQNYIPYPIGKKNFGFAGNQVKDLYEDELNLKASENLINFYEEENIFQDSIIKLAKLESEQLTIAIDSCQLRADNLEIVTVDVLESLKETEIKLNNTKRRLKNWRIGSLSGGAVIILVLILI